MRAKVDHVTDGVFLSDWRRKTLFEEGVFHLRPRSTCHAAAEAEQWLCSQMDKMERLRRVILYLPFPSDPASAAMHCAPAEHAPRSVSAPMISQSRCCWGTAVSEITGIAHRSGGRVGDGFALFPPVFPRSSALSGYTQFLRWSGWRRKLSLRREFSPALLAAPATLPLRRSSGCARRWIRWED